MKEARLTLETITSGNTHTEKCELNYAVETYQDYRRPSVRVRDWDDE